MNVVRYAEQRRFKSSIYGSTKRLVVGSGVGEAMVVSVTTDGVTFEGGETQGALGAFRFPENVRRILAVADRTEEGEPGGSVHVAVLWESRDFRVYVGYVHFRADLSSGERSGVVLTELRSLTALKAESREGSELDVRSFELLPFAQSVAVAVQGGHVLVANLNRTPGAWKAFASFASPSEHWLVRPAAETAVTPGPQPRTSLFSRLLSFSSAPRIPRGGSAEAAEVTGVLGYAAGESGKTWVVLAHSDGVLSLYQAPLPGSGETSECEAETTTRMGPGDLAPAWTLGWCGGARAVWVGEGDALVAYDAGNLRKLKTVRCPFAGCRVVTMATTPSGKLWVGVQTKEGVLEMFRTSDEEELEWVASRTWFLEAAVHEAEGVTEDVLEKAWKSEGDERTEFPNFQAKFWKRKLLREFDFETVETETDGVFEASEGLCARGQAVFKQLAEKRIFTHDLTFRASSVSDDRLFVFANGEVSEVAEVSDELVALRLSFLAIPAFGRSRFRASSHVLARLSERPAWRLLLAAGLLSQAAGAGLVAVASEFGLVYCGVEALDEILSTGDGSGGVAEKVLDGCDLGAAVDDLMALLGCFPESGNLFFRVMAENFRDVYLLSVWLAERGEGRLQRRLLDELDFARLLRRTWALVEGDSSSFGASEAVRDSSVEFLSWAMVCGREEAFERAVAAEEASEAWRGIFETSEATEAASHRAEVVEVVRAAVRRKAEAVVVEDLREVAELAVSAELEDLSPGGGALRKKAKAAVGVFWLWAYSQTRREEYLGRAMQEWAQLKTEGWLYVRGILGARIFDDNLRRRNFRMCIALIENLMSADQADRACRLLVAEAEAGDELARLFPSWPYFLKLAAAAYLREKTDLSPEDERVARQLWGVLTSLGQKDEARRLALAKAETLTQAESVRCWLVLAHVSAEEQQSEELQKTLRKRIVVEEAKRRTGESEIASAVRRLPISDSINLAKAADLDVWTAVVRPWLQELRTSKTSEDELRSELGRVVRMTSDGGVALKATRWCLARNFELPSEVVVAMESGNRWVLLLQVLMEHGRWGEATKLAKAHVRHWRPRLPGQWLSETLPIAKLQQLRDCVAIFRPAELQELDEVLNELKKTLAEA